VGTSTPGKDTLRGPAVRFALRYQSHLSLQERAHSMTSTITASKDFYFTSKDGLPIAYARWDSRGPARGVLQIAHGMGEHIGRYLELIEVLQDAGFVVYGNDHRGHGRTARSPEKFGDYGAGGFDLLVEDMIDRYRKAGVSDITLDSYHGGRHEMLNEINRREVRANLLAWLSKVLG